MRSVTGDRHDFGLVRALPKKVAGRLDQDHQGPRVGVHGRVEVGGPARQGPV